VGESDSHDGTLITKSHEAQNQSEVFVDLQAEAADGTLLTCTSEAKDAAEHVFDDLEHIGFLMGTKKTGSGEQSDPPDAVLVDYAEAASYCRSDNDRLALWPVSRFAAT
jgi:hypothetical protein